MRTERGDRIGAADLYGILRLRSEVFVVEQQCVFLDIDGADVLPTTTHLWTVDDAIGDTVACARVLAEGNVIGRVVTAATHRRQGIGAAIVKAALDLAGRPAHANAQSHLAGWYAQFGFAVGGEEFIEDGIPHLPLVAR